MGNSLSTGLSGIGMPGGDPGSALNLIPSQASQPSHPVDLLAVLRQSLADGSRAPAAIMHAATEGARILTGAHGVALAVRTKGLVVCRARSGDLAPELGAPLNTDSGISGECLRSASILLCHDTASDSRVDAEACRAMGIRSIVVVPLRGPTGIVGILEVFSTSIQAFGSEQIALLREFAEIAEGAYEREYNAVRQAAFASLRATPNGRLFKRATVTGETPANVVFDTSYTRRPWFVGVAVLAALLVAGVWLSSRDPAVEMAASEAPAPSSTAVAESRMSTPETVSIPKPRAGTKRDPGAAGVLKQAIQMDPEAESRYDTRRAAASVASTENFPKPSTGPSWETAPAPLSTALEPPSLTINASESGEELARLVTTSNTLPALEARVSQGITEGAQIQKVDPVYPEQARTLRLAGSVALEISIAENGTVGDVKVVSGLPLLAAAASDAVRQWRYSPFLLDGRPIGVRKQVTVVFKLP
jgi:TonB family protein